MGEVGQITALDMDHCMDQNPKMDNPLRQNPLRLLPKRGGEVDREIGRWNDLDALSHYIWVVIRFDMVICLLLRLGCYILLVQGSDRTP